MELTAAPSYGLKSWMVGRRACRGEWGCPSVGLSVCAPGRALRAQEFCAAPRAGRSAGGLFPVWTQYTISRTQKGQENGGNMEIFSRLARTRPAPRMAGTAAGGCAVPLQALVSPAHGGTARDRAADAPGGSGPSAPATLLPRGRRPRRRPAPQCRRSGPRDRARRRSAGSAPRPRRPVRIRRTPAAPAAPGRRAVCRKTGR